MTGVPSQPDRSTGCRILHVDMDAFFAAVAVRDRPDLAGLPVVVGGGDRGVVLSATYPARRFGVRSAMPMARARQLCPQAVVLRPDFTDLEAVSASVMAVFREVTPVVEALSLDEAFLDVSGAGRRVGSPLQIAEWVRARVHDEQRITCSVGVADTASVAKLAGRLAKPDGVLVVPPEDVVAFLHPLDAGELWGVGEKTRVALERLGLHTVGDVAHAPATVLRRALGPHRGAYVRALAWGADGRSVVARHRVLEPERSIGNEETFGRDTSDDAVLRRELLRLSAKVASRARAAGLAGRTVTLRVRFSDFTTITRSRTVAEATDVTTEVHGVACGLLATLGRRRLRVRLVGVRLSTLVERDRVHHQLVLGARERGWAEADRAVDAAALRFGSGVVRPATLIAAEGP